MKTRLSLIIMLLMQSTIMQACRLEGSGVMKSETRDVPVFRGVDLRNSASVYITQGETQSVRIEADDNLLAHIKTEVKSDALLIYSDDEINSENGIKVFITVKDLELIELSGSGLIAMENQLQGKLLTVRLSGSGEIKADIKMNAVKASLAGSGLIDLKGTTGTEDLRIAGSGNINAQNLYASTGSVTISGSGNGKIDVKNELTVHITGSGNIYYRDEPGKIVSKITGSGTVANL